MPHVRSPSFGREHVGPIRRAAGATSNLALRAAILSCGAEFFTQDAPQGFFELGSLTFDVLAQCVVN